jgi:hypothetical protein
MSGTVQIGVTGLAVMGRNIVQGHAHGCPVSTHMSQETRTMATPLVRGMGSFFKNCHCTRQNRCAHPYVVRYRDGTGRQREETRGLK